MAYQTRGGIHSMTVGGLFIRFFTSIAVLWITAFFTPGFEMSSIFTLTLAGIVLSIFDYLINSILEINHSALGRGIVSFITCALVLYFTQFFVPGYTISVMSSMIGAIIYGIVASIIPGKQNIQE